MAVASAVAVAAQSFTLPTGARTPLSARLVAESESAANIMIIFVASAW